jgi:hypothetical protein
MVMPPVATEQVGWVMLAAGALGVVLTVAVTAVLEADVQLFAVAST